jgi:anti-sigma factor RsiW
MKCAKGRRLFGSYWDDQTTQAEREWLESHFASCPACREEYEQFSRALEWAGSLPRVEAAPDLVDRVLARARRTSPVADRVPTRSNRWVPATAAAASLLVFGTLASPWLGVGLGPRLAAKKSANPTIQEPVLVTTRVVLPSTMSRVTPPVPNATDAQPVAAIPESLFNHGDDVEFVLDPVTLHRGRATVQRLPNGIQAERTAITF